MKLNPFALALTAGIVWAGAIFLTGIGNLMSAQYGVKFLEVMASLYPGFKASGTFLDVIWGTLYGLLDGFVCGYIFGWLYNILLGKFSKEG